MRFRTAFLSILLALSLIHFNGCSLKKLDEYRAIMDNSKLARDIKKILGPNGAKADLKGMVDSVIAYIEENKKDGFKSSLTDLKNQLLAMVSKAISELNISDNAKFYLLDKCTLVSSQLLNEIVESIKNGSGLEKVNGILKENNVPLSLSEEDIKNLVTKSTPTAAQVINNIKVASIDFKLDKDAEGIRRYNLKVNFSAELGNTPVNLEANSIATFEKNNKGKFELVEFKQNYINGQNNIPLPAQDNVTPLLEGTHQESKTPIEDGQEIKAPVGGQ